jgi:hypothetical protein
VLLETLMQLWVLARYGITCVAGRSCAGPTLCSLAASAAHLEADQGSEHIMQACRQAVGTNNDIGVRRYPLLKADLQAIERVGTIPRP